MPLLPVLLATFLLSGTCSMLEYGMYFLTENKLGFSDTANLLLALLFGLGYAGGAVLSHKASTRTGEKPLMAACLLAQVAMAGWIAWQPAPAVVFVANTVLAICFGLFWPVIESRIVAGRPGRAATRALGRFNLTWAPASVAGTAVSGLLLERGTGFFFATTAVINLAGLLLIAAAFPRQAEHLAHDHPEKPDAPTLARVKPLLASARIGMIASYMAILFLAPLVPKTFKALGLTPAMATVLAASAFGTRFLMFGILDRWHGWHLKAWPLALSAMAIPAGIYLTLFGPNVPVIVGGQALLGMALGAIYVASIDYGMIEKNASVEGGGDHELGVGLGFTCGPLLGLLGIWLGHFPALGANGGMALGMLPAAGLSLWMLRPLLRKQE